MLIYVYVCIVLYCSAGVPIDQLPAPSRAIVCMADAATIKIVEVVAISSLVLRALFLSFST